MNVKAIERTGGGLLFLGTVTFLITIYFEYRIGWIGGPERSKEEVAQYIYENWSQLKPIWSWQMFGSILIAASYILLIQTAKTFKGISIRLIWALLIVLSFMSVLAYGMTLGSYEIALEVYDSQPVLFDSLRGAIRGIFVTGKMGLLLLLVILALESLGPKGIIPRNIGIAALFVAASPIILAMTKAMDPKLIGIVTFIAPLTLGFYYWKSNRYNQINHTDT